MKNITSLLFGLLLIFLSTHTFGMLTPGSATSSTDLFQVLNKRVDTTNETLEALLASYHKCKNLNPILDATLEQIKKEKKDFSTASAALYEYLCSLLMENDSSRTPILVNHPKAQDFMSRVDDLDASLGSNTLISHRDEIANLNK